VVTPAIGDVVSLPFPFSDLSGNKRRPAVVVADASHGEWVLCQITSKAYSDPAAIYIADADFASGSLRVGSFARPAKLFTAHESLFTSHAGVLQPGALERVVEAIIEVIQPAS
jgi:mRNA interferase MazF